MTEAPSAATPTGPRVGFILAGVQKCGTSSLFDMLSAHPQIAESKSKELHYFDRDNRGWDSINYRKYERQFNWQPTSVIGAESTPNYVFWPGAMERIRAYNSAIRIALTFRDPIDRAFSHWSMAKQRDKSEPDFTEAVRISRATRWPRTAAEQSAVPYSFLSRGYYGQQLTRLRELFPDDQLLYMDYKAVFADSHGALDRITDFLGLDRFETYPEESALRQWTEPIRGLAPTAPDIALLAGLFAQDLRTFSELSGIDVSEWPTTRIVAGTLDPAEYATKLGEKAGLATTPQAIKKERHRVAAKALKATRKAARKAAEVEAASAPSPGGESPIGEQPTVDETGGVDRPDAPAPTSV